MDPISALAGVLSISEAVGAIGHGLKVLKSLANASAEFCDLLNELEAIQALLAQNQTTIEGLSDPKAQVPVAELNAVVRMQVELSQACNHVSGLVQELMSESDGRLNRDGLPRVPKIKWLMRKEKIQTVRDRLKRCRENLVASLATLGTSQSARQSKLIIDVHDVFEVTSRNLMRKTDQVLSQSAENATRLNHIAYGLSALIAATGIGAVRAPQGSQRIPQEENSDPGCQAEVSAEGQRPRIFIDEPKSLRMELKGPKKEISESNVSEDLKTLALDEPKTSLKEEEQKSLDAWGHTTPGSPVSHRAGRRASQALVDARFSGINAGQLTRMRSRFETDLPLKPRQRRNLSSVICIQGSVKEPCDPLCKCQCHRTSTVESPTWLQSVLGTFFLHYNSLPMLDSRPCNSHLCRAKSAKAASFQYRFPKWLLARAIFLSTSWSNFAGVEASLHLKIPRVTRLAGLKRALESEDCTWLQKKYGERKFLPTDIDEDGISLVSDCLRRGAIQVAVYLFQIGFNPCFADMRGQSCVSVAMELLLSGNFHQSEQNIRALEAICEHGDDIIRGGSTIVHDSVLGLGSISLPDAIAGEPFNLNVKDGMGHTPLHWAACRADYEGAVALLEAGADVNFQTRGTGETPLHLACAAGSAHIASLLLASGAFPSAKDFRGRTPLHVAIDNIDLVRILISYKADPTAADAIKAQPLHLPLNPSAVLDRETISLLQSAGASLDAVDKYLQTPLILASRFSNVPLMALLSDAGASYNAFDMFNQSVVHKVACFGELGQMQFLRDQVQLGRLTGLDPDTEDCDSDSALRCFKQRFLVAEQGAWAGARAAWVCQAEVYTLSALVVELREANWAAGLFTETKKDLGRLVGGSHEDLCRWLSVQGRRLEQDKGFAELPWRAVDKWFDQLDALEMDELTEEGIWGSHRAECRCFHCNLTRPLNKSK